MAEQNPTKDKGMGPDQAARKSLGHILYQSMYKNVQILLQLVLNYFRIKKIHLEIEGKNQRFLLDISYYLINSGSVSETP